MVSINIVPTTTEHIKILLEELKQLNNDDAYRFGAAKEEVLLKVYARSLYCNTAIVNGAIIAIWGILGEHLGKEGRPWSLMSPETEKYPFRMKSFYNYELSKMLQLFPVLIDMVDIKHTKVLRMLKIMGFTFEEPKPFMGGMFIKAQRSI